MYKVRMFDDWGDGPQGLIDKLIHQTKNMTDANYENVEFVTDDDYDYAIAFNYPVYDFACPKENVISLLLEPPEVIEKFYHPFTLQNSHKEFEIYSFAIDPPSLPAHGIGFATAGKGEKKKAMKNRKKACFITSNKLITPHHFKRQQIFNELLEAGLDIDFYGRHMRLIGNDRVKGEIPPMAKNTVLVDYQYVIDFENSNRNVVTDKFYDPILCGAKPITNAAIVEEFVPEGSYSLVDFTQPPDNIVEQVAGFLEQGEPDTKLINQAKEVIINGKMSITKWIHEKVNELANGTVS